MNNFQNTIITADNIDSLVQQGVRHILKDGERFDSRSGSGLQAYTTTYVLTDPSARIHTLRAPQSVQYLARELQAYFIGSQNVEDGLAQAAPFWRTLSDTNGNVCSNYGHYVFHQKTPFGITQFDWVRQCFKKNRDTRKAFININSISHKTDTKDFPCTIGVQFFMRGDVMYCEVASRSTDVITGLPYDMGFFSLVNELVAGAVGHDIGVNIKTGYTAMVANFTQIYDKTADKAQEVLRASADLSAQKMPAVDNALASLDDIMNIEACPPKTKVIQWVTSNSKLPISYES